MALVKCPNCNADISSAADVCPKCGSTGVRTKICYECKSSIPASSIICPNCGHPQDKVFITVGIPPFLDDGKKWKITSGPLFNASVLASGVGYSTVELKLEEPTPIRFVPFMIPGCSIVAVPGKRYKVESADTGELLTNWKFTELN